MMTRKPAGSVKVRPRALVTGGAIRLGRAIALALARSGMDVAISYHRSRDEARTTVRSIERLGVRGIALQADLARAPAARRLVQAAARALGGLDVLVNNAGVFARTPLDATTAAAFDAVLAVNVRAPFLCTQAAAAVMPDGGHIVNIADAGADEGWPAYLAYSISKAGVIALTRGLARALAPRGITVNCVAPGRVLRPTGFPHARWARLRRGHAETVDDVTDAVVAFATCPPARTGRILKIER
jgi:NAD(P)-dependent dehydrogenase (short-subunit alcohol dehydrogenase family)